MLSVLICRPHNSVRVCREGHPWDDSLDDSRTFADAQSKDSLTRSLAGWMAEEMDDNSVAVN